jgi:hypothetical protein
MRKAYLCHSNIKDIPDGSVLAFYRSQQNQGIIALGVVEKVRRSSSANIIAHTVGKRTVYSMREIKNISYKPVLSILFRQTRSFHPELPLKDLIPGGVFRSPPQSIIRIPKEGILCIKRIIA